MTPYQVQPNPPTQPPPYPNQQEQPMYQPPQSVPPKLTPKPKRRRLWIILGVIVAILVIGTIVLASQIPAATPGITPQATHPATQATQPAAAPTTQPATQPPQVNTNSIGKAVQVSGTWLVTVNSAKTTNGDQFDTPKTGNTYLVVDVTLQNTSSTNQVVSSFIMFSLKDSTGQQYTQTFTSFAKASPDGTLKPNSLLRGQMVYEVPTSVHMFTFSFQSDFIGNDFTEWPLAI